MNDRLAKTSVAIDPALAKRWSGRAFDARRNVSRDDIIALLEAARWAPSCFGDQPWRYLVWDRSRDAQSWQRAFDCLGEWNQGWVKNTPLLLAACADDQFMGNGKPNRWGQYDTGAASENLCIQASALGLMAHQMGGFDPDKLRATFAIPERYTPMAMIAVGHPAPADILNAELKEKELAPRARAPLGERFFEGAWERPIAT